MRLGPGQPPHIRGGSARNRPAQAGVGRRRCGGGVGWAGRLRPGRPERPAGPGPQSRAVRAPRPYIVTRARRTRACRTARVTVYLEGTTGGWCPCTGTWGGRPPSAPSWANWRPARRRRVRPRLGEPGVVSRSFRGRPCCAEAWCRSTCRVSFESLDGQDQRWRPLRSCSR